MAKPDRSHPRFPLFLRSLHCPLASAYLPHRLGPRGKVVRSGNVILEAHHGGQRYPIKISNTVRPFLRKSANILSWSRRLFFSVFDTDQSSLLPEQTHFIDSTRVPFIGRALKRFGPRSYNLMIDGFGER